jgi:hypothetical protein
MRTGIIDVGKKLPPSRQLFGKIEQSVDNPKIIRNAKRPARRVPADLV